MNTHLIVLPIFCCSLLANANAFAGAHEFDFPKGCPEIDYQAVSEHVSLIVGRGDTSTQSQDRAVDSLAMQLGRVSIESSTQIIQSSERTRVYDQVHVSLERKFQNQFQYFSTHQCQQGFVSYLAYDPRSLAMRLADTFSNNYRQVQTLPSSAHPNMYFMVSPDGQWFIQYKDKKLAISYDEWLGLMSFPSSTLDVSSTLGNSKRTIMITMPDRDESFDVVICSHEGECQLVGIAISRAEVLHIVLPKQHSLLYVAAIQRDKFKGYRQVFTPQILSGQAMSHYQLWQILEANGDGVSLAFSDAF